MDIIFLTPVPPLQRRGGQATKEECGDGDCTRMFLQYSLFKIKKEVYLRAFAYLTVFGFETFGIRQYF